MSRSGRPGRGLVLGLAAWALLATVPAIALAQGGTESVAELKAALAELRRRLAEQPRSATDAELRVARRQIEHLTAAMVGLRRERDALRAELVGLRAESERLRAADAARELHLSASTAEVARLRSELAQAATKVVPVVLAAREPIDGHRVLAGSAFAPGGAELRPDVRAQLGAIAAWLQDEPAGRVVVEGHTDAIGDEEANRRLSLARAGSVRDELVALGVSAARIEVLGRGESKPMADNGTPEGRAANRRVMVRLEP